MKENEKIFSLIDKIDSIATEIGISHNKQKTVSGCIMNFFLDEKSNSDTLLYEYKRIENLSEIVNDYLLGLDDTINELQKLTGQLHDEYTKNSLSKA